MRIYIYVKPYQILNTTVPCHKSDPSLRLDPPPVTSTNGVAKLPIYLISEWVNELGWQLWNELNFGRLIHSTFALYIFFIIRFIVISEGDVFYREHYILIIFGKLFVWIDIFMKFLL